MKKTILCFGSENKGDDLAWEIGKSLENKIPGTDFIRCESPLEIRDHVGKKFLILDVVKGIEKPRVFTKMEDFSVSKKVTAHDLDLSLVLRILESLEGPKFRVIGIPFGKKKNEVAEDVRKLISSV